MASLVTLLSRWRTWCKLYTPNLSVLINGKNQFVWRSLRLIISTVPYSFHVMLYAVSEESRGSNVSRSHGSRPDGAFLLSRLLIMDEHLGLSFPRNLFHLSLVGISFRRNLGSVLTHNSHIYLALTGGEWFGVSFLKENGLPERHRGVSLCGDRYFKRGWTWSWAACPGWPCLCRTVWLGDGERSLLSSAALWFCKKCRETRSRNFC